MKKTTLFVAIAAIVVLLAASFAACEKIKTEDVVGDWYLEDGKLTVSADGATFNGEKKEFVLNAKNGFFSVSGQEYLVGDNNSSVYAKDSKAQNVMTRPAKRDSFAEGEGFTYTDAQGRLCTLAFHAGNKVSVSYVGQGTLGADLGEGTYSYSDGVVTALVQMARGDVVVLFYYIDKNVDLYTKAGVREVPDFAKTAYDDQLAKANGQQTTFTVTYTAGEGGSVSGETQQTVRKNADTTSVRAVAEEGYEFEKWSDGNTSASRKETNVTSDMTLKAVFTKIRYTVTYSAGANGSVSGVTTQKVAHGENGKKVVAIPASGYVFAGWSDGVKTAERYEEKVKGNKSFTANFAKGVTVNYVAALGGSIQGKDSQFVGVGTEGSTVVAIPADGYVFSGWSDGWFLPARTDTGEKDVTYTAYFAETQKVVVRYSAGKGGRIEGCAVQQVDIGKDALKVVAVADTGYVFAAWSDGVMTAERTDTAVVSAINAEARFIKIAQSIVTIDYGDGQTFKVTMSKGDKVNFPIPERPGYRFVAFDTPQGNIVNGEVWQQDQDCEVSAIWENITYNIILNAGLGSVSQNTLNYTVDDLPLALPDAAHETLVFNGWRSPDGNYVEQITADNFGDIYLSAHFSEDNERLTYTLNQAGTGYIVSGYEGKSGKIIVPSEKDGLPVTEIAAKVFEYNAGVTYFRAGENLESIGAQAFYYCKNLTEVDLSRGIDLVVIGDSAFDKCSKLSVANLDNCAALKTIGNGAFSATALTEINLKGCVSLESIQSYAFLNTMLATIDVSGLANLKEVGLNAFSCSTMTNAYFNDCESLASMIGVFGNGTLKKLEIRNCPSLGSYDVLFGEATVETLDITGSCGSFPPGRDLPSSVNVTKLYLDDAQPLNSMYGENAFFLAKAQRIALAGDGEVNNSYFFENFKATGATEDRNGETYTIYTRKTA